MDQKLYDMMDWAAIEGLVYSEEDQPHEILGASVVDEGILIQTFIPTAERIEVAVEGVKKHYAMEKEDDNGFYAVIIPGKKKVPKYTLLVTYDNDVTEELQDPYNYEPQIPETVLKKFDAGICYDIYKYLGAHTMTVDGDEGVYFAVWAPNAMRVSLVGDFNLWDGRRLPMRRIKDHGIFELFIPGLKAGNLYKYEVKAKNGLTFLKADPYAAAAQLRPDSASIVADLSDFKWTDDKWMADQALRSTAAEPVAISEVDLGTFARAEDGSFLNYRELAEKVAVYVKETGYTHLELMPVMEYPHDETWGYQTLGYYAPTARYGSPEDFKYFMNYMHEQGIPVILDWCPAHFPRDVHGLCGFDGTCLYEHQDPRKGTYPQWNTLIYNYARPQVTNFLIASALYWVKEYHADGLRLDNVAAMLYLDYGKKDGEWVANIYGGNENLDAVEFLKHLNSIFKKNFPGALLIAEEKAAWPRVTGSVDDGALGFDYKWNDGWQKDFLGYMQLDPIFRGGHHGDLTFSMVYNYSENYLLPLDHNCVTYGNGSLRDQMPGRTEHKLANLRAALGFTFTHPGKKLMFMGQELAPKGAWKGKKPVDWALKETEEGSTTYRYMQALLNLYKSYPALYANDYDPNGFEWINSISSNENMLVFLRKTDKVEENLLVVVNFSNVVYENHKIGVPYPGKFKEIFSSDAVEFGGSGNTNPRVKASREEECDGRDDSIRVKVPAMSVSVFTCTRVEKAEKPAKAAAKKTTAKKTAAKKTTAKKAAPKTAAKKEETTSKKTGITDSSRKSTGKSLREALEENVHEAEKDS